MRKIVAFILAILSGFFFFQCGQRQVDQTTQQKQTQRKTTDYILDTVITREIPLTVDGDSATIYYQLKVKDWKKPVEWTFDVVLGKDIVYSMVSNEAWLDSNFYDFGYVPQALDTTYLGQKRFWYLKRIISYHTHKIDITKRSSLIKEQQYCSKYWTTKDDTIEIQHDAYWNDFWNHYKNKPVITYSFYCQPCDNPGLMAYYPRLKKIVLIAHD